MDAQKNITPRIVDVNKFQNALLDINTRSLLNKVVDCFKENMNYFSELTETIKNKNYSETKTLSENHKYIEIFRKISSNINQIEEIIYNCGLGEKEIPQYHWKENYQNLELQDLFLWMRLENY